MYRGTTPTFSLKLNTTINFEEISECYVTIASKTVCVSISKERLNFDNEQKRIEVTLSQQETLSFYEGDVEVQVRIKMVDGTAYATSIYRTKVDKILKDGVI